MMHPSRMPPMGGPMGMPPQTGMIRTADQMEGASDDVPPAKRQKVAKLPGGALYPEQDWINMHPVRRPPSFPHKSSAKLTRLFI